MPAQDDINASAALNGGIPALFYPGSATNCTPASFSMNCITPPKMVIIRLTLKQVAKSEVSACTPSLPRSIKASVFRFRLICPKGCSALHLRRAYITCDASCSYCSSNLCLASSFLSRMILRPFFAVVHCPKFEQLRQVFLFVI